MNNSFHYAFKVKDLESTRQFYGDVLGCREGRSIQKANAYSGERTRTRKALSQPALSRLAFLDPLEDSLTSR